MHTRTRYAVSKAFVLVAIAVTLTGSGWAQATEKILYSFTGSADGGYPQSGLVADSKGNLYGTTSQGGSGAYCHCGTIFELIPGANGTWTESVLHSFGASSTDGTSPFSQPVFDSKGNLYGTTSFGGANFQGTVYELSPANGGWIESVLYTFTGGADGGSIDTSRLTIDRSGNLYGVTNSGGVFGFGVVFELSPGSNGTWTEKVLHSFTGGDDGGNPYASSVVLDSSGSLYGTARGGGAHDYGVVFGLTPQSNGTWSEKVIYDFPGGAVGADPIGGLLLDSSGKLYGAAFDVFELVPGSNGMRTKKMLHSFTGTPDGAFPEAALISDKAGNLYGTTNSGGAHNGTVFELMPGPNGNWNERVLHRFSGGTDGVSPNWSSLAMDAGGNLYGTTQTGGASNVGVVFEVTP
jgi:uncharacterized repeat protein (TIGR03803 family)